MSLLEDLQERRKATLEQREYRRQQMVDWTEALAESERSLIELDKAISALTPEGKGILLDGQHEQIPTEVRKEDEQDAAGDWTNGGEDRLDAVCAELLKDLPPPQEAPAIPEGVTQQSELAEFLQKDGAVEHRGGPCPVPSNWIVEVLTRGCGIWPLKNIDQIGAIWWWEGEEAHPTNIIAYRITEASAGAERIEDASQGTLATEQTEHDRPKLTDEEHNSLEKLDDKPSTVFLDQAQAAINDRIEDEPSEAAVFAHGLNIEIDQKAEAKPTFASAVAKLFQMGDA